MVSCKIVTKTRKLPVKTVPLVRRIAKSRGGEKEYFCSPNPKILPCDSGGEPATFNAAVDAEAASAPEHQDLAELVWKYFEKEIRETLIEVQEVIGAEHSQSTGQTS